MPSPEISSVLIVQTAYLGDVILTTPLVKAVKSRFPSASVDIVVVPRAAEILAHNPDLRITIEFDKRGMDRGLRGLWRLARTLRRSRYDLALVPHRSIRSAVLVRLAGIDRRIGFDRSAGRLLFTQSVKYDRSAHEVDRNLKLLEPFGSTVGYSRYPTLAPSPDDVAIGDRFLERGGLTSDKQFVSVAPGTVWNTKRWPEERFREVIRTLNNDGVPVVLIGGKEDAALCRLLVENATGKLARTISAAGELSLLQSAVIIRRSRLLISNDSAPMHLALAMRTPILAIYGATVPEFGFAPFGEFDHIMETKGLDCRPCSNHGGNQCPIGTFDCMLKISSTSVVDQARRILALPNR